jgi:hypothetical protein
MKGIYFSPSEVANEKIDFSYDQIFRPRGTAKIIENNLLQKSSFDLLKVEVPSSV